MTTSLPLRELQQVLQICYLASQRVCALLLPHALRIGELASLLLCGKFALGALTSAALGAQLLLSNVAGLLHVAKL